MTLIRKTSLGLMFGLALTGIASCEKEAAPKVEAGPRTEITFSILSTEKSQDLQVLWGPLIADMEKQTGLKVKPFYAPNYTSLIEAMRFDKVQVGWFSNTPGLEAIRRADGEVLVQTTYPTGIPGYTSVVIVPKDSKLTIEDIMRCDKTLNFGMGDVKSTSGTQAPLYYLFLPAKKDPNTCFKAVKSANHQANIEGVIAGVMDAATNNSSALRELAIRSPAKHAKIKVIWQSPILPTDVIIYRKNVDPATREKLRSFFLSYGTGTGPEADRQRAVLNGLIMGNFKPDDNDHFLPTRLMEAATNLMAAQNAGDKAAIAKAEAALKQVRADQAAYDAKHVIEAPADRPPSDRPKA